MSIKYDRFTDIEVVLQNMVEVTFPDGAEEGFRKVKETLQRMGVASRKDKVLIQTAHILHKRGRYYICHFKELFGADGKTAELSDGDIARRNLIVKYLKDWDMVTPISTNFEHPMGSPRMLKVLKHHERDDWELAQKYTIGTKRRDVA